jgi:dUTP pyrophosphatase
MGGELQLFMKTKHLDLYSGHASAFEGDSGIDLFFVEDVVVKAGETMLIDLEVACELRQLSSTFASKGQTFYGNLSYFLYPRSSIYKTPLRMSNSVGIIDSKYRNTIKAPVDNISDQDYTISKGTRLFQICAPNLQEIKLVLTDKLSETNRGSGFGSSGV